MVTGNAAFNRLFLYQHWIKFCENSRLEQVSIALPNCDIFKKSHLSTSQFGTARKHAKNGAMATQKSHGNIRVVNKYK